MVPHVVAQWLSVRVYQWRWNEFRPPVIGHPDLPFSFVYHPVMVPAQKDTIGQVRCPAVDPMPNVVGLAPMRTIPLS